MQPMNCAPAELMKAIGLATTLRPLAWVSTPSGGAAVAVVGGGVLRFSADDLAPEPGCKRCGDSGVVEVLIRHRDPDSCGDEYVPCPDCRGQGWLSDY